MPPEGSTLGAGVLAAALQHHGVRFVFGVVGIPIIEVREGTQSDGNWRITAGGLLSWRAAECMSR